MAYLKATHGRSRVRSRSPSLLSIKQTALFGAPTPATEPIYIALVNNQPSNENQTIFVEGIIDKSEDADGLVTYAIEGAPVKVHAITPLYGLGNAISAHYFDGSDAAASDPGGVWTNDANAFDNSTTTLASTTTSGSSSTNFLKAEGTDAPASGGPISLVRIRIRAGAGGGGVVYSAFQTINAPAAGWDWAALQALEVRFWRQSDGSGGSDIMGVVATDGDSETLLTSSTFFNGFGAASSDIYYAELEVSYTPYAANTNSNLLNTSGMVYAETPATARYFNEGMRWGLNNGGTYVAIVWDYSVMTSVDLFASISRLTTTNVMAERPFGWVINQSCYAAGGDLDEGVAFDAAIDDWKSAIVTAGKSWST